MKAPSVNSIERGNRRRCFLAAIGPGQVQALDAAFSFKCGNFSLNNEPG
jgi:hypothetical protein